jgi:hypothetical protein
VLYGLTQTLDHFPEGARSLGLVTYFGMEGPGPWWEKPTRCQSDHDDYVCYCGRVAMSGDDGMEKYLNAYLSGAHGSMQLPLVMPGLKWCCLPRIQLQRCLPGSGESSGMTARGSYCAGSRGGFIVDRQVIKSCLSMTIVMGERTNLDHS